jgi:predicted nucleic acid-binding protein
VIVGIDSNILIYAGLVPKSATGTKSAEQAALTRRAKILLHDLREAQVILPMDAIAELLIPVPIAKHGLLIGSLREIFTCPDFGDRAASVAADLWARYKQVPVDQKYDDRHVMRSDVKIIATAKANGATKFYTNDDTCRALASLIMTGKGLPTASDDLFIDETLASGLEEKPKSRKRKGKKAT